MIDVEIYQPPSTGTALDPKRDGALESEIREHELIAQRNAALPLGLAAVVAACDTALARLRCARRVPFPLMTAEEVSVWRAFLPTVYTDNKKKLPEETTLMSIGWRFNAFQSLEAYSFDTPPLSVLEAWTALRAAKMFEEYQVWTPERPMPEPILAGYTMFDGREIGPFLIARWGEALDPFWVIQATVAERAARRAEAVRAMAGAQQSNPPQFMSVGGLGRA